MAGKLLERILKRILIVILMGASDMEIVDHYIINLLQDFDLLFRIFVSTLLGFFIG